MNKFRYNSEVIITNHAAYTFLLITTILLRLFLFETHVHRLH